MTRLILRLGAASLALTAIALGASMVMVATGAPDPSLPLMINFAVNTVMWTAVLVILHVRRRRAAGQPGGPHRDSSS